MHQSGIVCNNQFGLLHQVGRFVQVKLTAGVVYFYLVLLRNSFTIFIVFFTTQ